MEREEKKFEIIVNGRPKPWQEVTINYAQVVNLAFPQITNPTDIFTVQYSHGTKEQSQGTMVEGQSVTIKSGMIFDVTRTFKS